MRGRNAPLPDPFGRIAPYYDALMASVPYSLWADYVTRLADMSGRLITPGGRLLDLATGTGSVALEFAARGSIVTGVDLSEPMVIEARRKADERALTADFLCADLRDFSLPQEFDHAVCLYDSLNYILEEAHLKQAFANTRAALKPGGLLIFDVNTVHALEAELFTQRSLDGAPVKYRWVSKYNASTRISRITMRFEIPTTREKFTAVHHQRAYSDGELRSLLEGTGFTDIASYEAYRVAPPGPLTDRAFYVARAAIAS